MQITVTICDSTSGPGGPGVLEVLEVLGVPGGPGSPTTGRPGKVMATKPHTIEYVGTDFPAGFGVPVGYPPGRTFW